MAQTNCARSTSSLNPSLASTHTDLAVVGADTIAGAHAGEHRDEVQAEQQKNRTQALEMTAGKSRALSESQ